MSPKEQTDHSIGLEPLQKWRNREAKTFSLWELGTTFLSFSAHGIPVAASMAGPSLDDVYCSHTSLVDTLCQALRPLEGQDSSALVIHFLAEFLYSLLQFPPPQPPLSSSLLPLLPHLLLPLLIPGTKSKALPMLKMLYCWMYPQPPYFPLLFSLLFFMIVFRIVSTQFILLQISYNKCLGIQKCHD